MKQFSQMNSVSKLISYGCILRKETLAAPISDSMEPESCLVWFERFEL